MSTETEAAVPSAVTPAAGIDSAVTPAAGTEPAGTRVHDTETPKAPLPKEIGGAKGPEPTRYGDWEHKGRCTDF